MKAQPFNVFFDGIDVFVAFFLGGGVVKAQVALPVIDIRQPEIQADGFGVPDMQTAAGIERKAGLNGGVIACFQVVFN